MEQTIEEFATVTGNGSVNIPAKIRERLNIKKGSKIKFIIQDGALLVVPVLTFREMRGLDEEHKELILEGIRELEREHRREAKLDRDRN